ncbi:unnamed protein product [Symbiodinium microadriaticum]|nr:unnamed protein product [Symbiodinium microadriaticum]
MIMQLVDLFIGDNSPCNGELYSQGSRKRAGTSYVSVVFDKNGKLPKSAEYIPDWTDLLHTLRWLVLSSYSNAMVRMATTPPTLNVHRSGAVVLDPYSHRCMTCKVFYTHALRQARYVDIINDIMAHYVYDDIKWTDDVASIILESITFAANDSTGHYFKALESFLSIHDNYVQHRASVVLDGQTGLLQMLKSCIVNKPTFVCICLFSLFKMALRINSVFSNLSTSQSKINEWAPWILKFCYQFGEKMRKETIALEFEQSIKSTTPSDANTPAPKKRGPFLTIYGECQPECEDTWVERGGKTFNLVQEVIRAMGAVPEVLIPADAFDDVVSAVGGSSPDAAIAIPDDIALPDTPDTGTIGVGGAVVNVNGGSTLPEAAFGDAMTDEEFARFMAETAGSELD